jgi:hypothetical protein
VDRKALKGFGMLLVGVLIVGALVLPASGQNRVRAPWKQVRPRADARYLQNSRTYVSAPHVAATAANASATVACPAGWQAVGGGVDFDDDNALVNVISDGPTLASGNLVDTDEGRNPAATGWKVSLLNADATTAHTFVVAVVCTH